MANRGQDFLRKVGKGWSPVHMNLNRPKVAYLKPKKTEETKIIESDSKPTNDKPKTE